MNNINHFPCIPLTVPPWRKYCSTVEKISFHHEDVYKRQLHIMAKLGEPSSLRKNIPELSNAVNREKGTNQIMYSTANGVSRSDPPSSFAPQVVKLLGGSERLTP